MTTLSADEARPLELGTINELPVIASDIIYEGAVVGDNGSGYARPLQSGDPFRGFAERKADNSSGSAGDINVRVRTKGLIKLSVGSLAITDVGRPVYATDDDTFVLTGIGTRIGYVYRYVSSGVGIVAYDATVPEKISVLSIPITLSNLADGDVLTEFTPGFAGRVKAVDFAVGVPVTTGSKAATLNLEIGTTDLTGGVVELTSANCTPLGKIVAGSAITDGAAFTDSDSISVEASSVTAFAEGDGYLLITLGQ